MQNFRAYSTVSGNSSPVLIKYAWGGFFYTAFQIDPQEELIAIFMGQLRPNGHLKLDQKVIQLAAQSIID